MKKKLFAILSAATLGLTALCAPASAQTHYLKGDVNMDGSVTAEDAQLALRYYVWSLACKWMYEEPPLTEEQVELARIYGEEYTESFVSIDGEVINTTIRVTAWDAQAILNYYVMRLAQHDVTIEEVAWRTK